MDDRVRHLQTLGREPGRRNLVHSGLSAFERVIETSCR